MNDDFFLPKLKKNKLLSEICTFGIGGPAEYYLEVETISEMQEALKQAREHQIPVFILGKGSNCLFDDRGFKGLVIANKIDFVENPASGIYRVGAGYSFSLLGVQTARQGWGGLEFASGIPASVGGAVFMNAGANGSETENYLSSVEYVADNGELLVLNKSELQFSYRCSPFQKMKGAIAAATFSLFPSEKAREKQLEIIQYRLKTQPYKERSAGCVFCNPQGSHAGALIEQAGLKGSCIGGAQVSTMHANFVVNRQHATSRDVVELINKIRIEIKEKTGFELKSEVRIIPYLPEEQ